MAGYFLLLCTYSSFYKNTALNGIQTTPLLIYTESHKAGTLACDFIWKPGVGESEGCLGRWSKFFHHSLL